MKKLPATIGKALLNSFILHSSLGTWVNGYTLMNNGKEIMNSNWSSGSFHPALAALVKDEMIEKRKAGSRRLTFEYKTTEKGRQYLQYISTYFKHAELRRMINALMEGNV